jgi:hypothetical protein
MRKFLRVSLCFGLETDICKFHQLRPVKRAKPKANYSAAPMISRYGHLSQSELSPQGPGVRNTGTSQTVCFGSSVPILSRMLVCGPEGPRRHGRDKKCFVLQRYHRTEVTYLKISLLKERKLTAVGWSSDPNSGSYTWFDSLIMSHSSNSSGEYLLRRSLILQESGGRRRIHKNRVANSEHHLQHVIWDNENSDDSQKAWLASIKAGDIIQIVPGAIYAGWVNFVQQAEIEIIGSRMTHNPKPLTLENIGTTKTYHRLETELREIRLIEIQPGYG